MPVYVETDWQQSGEKNDFSIGRNLQAKTMHKTMPKKFVN